MKKALVIIFRYVFPMVGWLALLWALVSFGLYRLFPWEYEELRRVASPDGKYEAVVTRGNAGAMTSYRYGVCIVPSGAVFDPKDAVFDSNDLDSSDVSWSDRRTLEIVHAPGRIWYYESTWPYPRKSEDVDSVTVILKTDYTRQVPNH